MTIWTVWLTLAAAVLPAAQGRVRAPLVMLVGCAGKSAQPQIWDLTRAGARTESSRAGISASERGQLARQALGQDAYQLIGVADFVDTQTSRTIGDRGAILTPPRVNATGMLADGRKVAVKGLLIDATPPRVNLTSVADLGPCQ
jgi:hypothetical protein